MTIILNIDELDFNTSVVVTEFPSDEGQRFPLTDLFVPIPVYDDAIDEANDQFFIVRLEIEDAVNPNLITLEQSTSRCRIVDNDRKYCC